MIFGALLDWTKEAEEFYLNASVFRNTPKIKNLLIRKFTQKDGVLVVFGYESPLSTIPIYLSIFSAGLGIFFLNLFQFVFISRVLFGFSGFFVFMYVLTTPLIIFELFRLGLKRAHYSGKLQRLNKEQIIRRIVKK